MPHPLRNVFLPWSSSITPRQMLTGLLALMVAAGFSFVSPTITNASPAPVTFDAPYPSGMHVVITDTPMGHERRSRFRSSWEAWDFVGNRGGNPSVVTPFDGTVWYQGLTRNERGEHVIIRRDAGGDCWLFQHLQAGSTGHLRVGQAVRRADVIGRQGKTGWDKNGRELYEIHLHMSRHACPNKGNQEPGDAWPSNPSFGTSRGNSTISSTSPYQQPDGSVPGNTSVDGPRSDANRDGVPDVFSINRNDSPTGRTAIHVMDGASGYSRWLSQAATLLHATDTTWDFEVADANRDGAPDVYAINRNDSPTGRTAIHVMDGASGYTRWVSQHATLLHATDASWDFEVADANRDGAPDVFAINRNDSSTGRTAIHVMDGASGYTRWLSQAATVLHATDTTWDFEVGDANRDGVLDVYSVNRNDGAAGRTAIHVMDGASGYTRWVSQHATLLHMTDASWDFEVADANRDGLPDVYAINRNDSPTGRTAIHVMDGASGYGRWLSQHATLLHATDPYWAFAA